MIVEERRSTDFLRSDAADPPVTVIREFRVRTGGEVDFERLMSLLVNEAIRQLGHLGAMVLRPHYEGDTYRFVYKFEKRSQLVAWHGSELRASLIAPVKALIEFDKVNEYPGLETWFDPPGTIPPPKWKTTLLSWAAIYLLVLAISYAMRVLGLALPLPIRLLIGSAIVVPLVAYGLGPWLGRAFHGWLHAGLPVPARERRK